MQQWRTLLPSLRGLRSVSGDMRGLASLHPAIPQSPVSQPQNAEAEGKSRDTVTIDPATIEHLERISLVDFANVRGIERLEEAIDLAQAVVEVDTRGVEPLYSILEEETLNLRQDVPEPPNNRRELLKMASVTEEEYFVAPQGNVPLSTQKTYDRPS